MCAVLTPTALMPGCAWVRNDDDIFDSYGAGRYRPEGRSVEGGRKGTILEDLGLTKPPQKDLELAKQQFAEAEGLFDTAKQMERGEQRAEAFRAASELYLEAGANYRSSYLEQDALIGAAESLFFAEDFYQAEQLYARLLKEYERTKYLDHAESRLWYIADYWANIAKAKPSPFYMINFTDPKEPWNDTGGHSERILERLRMNNPTGDLGDDATMRLAMQHYENEDWEAAAATFAELRSIYPDSEHQFNAQFFELQALLASYQGPDYSEVPITDALARVKQIARQFPVKAQEKQEELKKAYGTLRYLQAERIWAKAQYRITRQENASAIFYLDQIINEFQDTPFAGDAKQAKERLADLPPDPPQHFKFLADWFGENEEDRPWMKDQ